MVAALSDPGLLRLVLVALLSGAAGAVVATILQNRHERAERLKERRLDAADEFMTGFMAAVAVLADLTKEGKLHDAASLLSLRRDLSSRGGSLITSVARVRLLFGSGSAADKAAGEMLDSVGKAVSAVMREPPDFAEARTRVWGTDPAMNAFVNAANRAIV